MKILFVIHEGALSGANAALATYMRILSGQGFELYLITPRLGDLSAEVSGITEQVYEVYYYGWTVSPKKKSSLANRLRVSFRNQMAVRQIRKIIKSIRPDFCVTNTITIDVGAMAAEKENIRHVWFVHEYGELDHGFSFACGMQKARERILKLSYKVAVNSLAVMSTYPPDPKLSLVYNYVDSPDVKVAKRELTDQMDFLLLGQIAKSKNQAEAIRALTLARAQGYNFTLSLFGKIVNEAYFEELKKLIHESGMNDYVKFNGYADNVFELFGRYHALIMCSRQEAFGRVTLEALMAGLPVIGADSGGTKELIDDGVNGLYYKSGNAEDLCLKMISLFNNYKEFDATEIRNNIMNRFNKDNTFRQLLELFQ